MKPWKPRLCVAQMRRRQLFSGAVSHDLRTPLATIEAALDGLQSGELVLTPKTEPSCLDSIRLEHLRLKRLVEDLLSTCRGYKRAPRHRLSSCGLRTS